MAPQVHLILSVERRDSYISRWLKKKDGFDWQFYDLVLPFFYTLIVKNIRNR